MKTLIILLLLVISLPITSQTYLLKAHHVVLTTEDITKNGNVDVDVVLNTNENRIIIYSQYIQIIDYNILRSYIDKDNYSVTECVATDSDYKHILLTVSINKIDNIIILTITYPNIMYSYFCKLT